MSVPPGTLDTGGRRPTEKRIRLLLIGLVALMAVVAGLFGVLYMGAASDAATANSALANARAEATSAAAARDKAADRATTAEDERDSARATAQDLQACQQAAKDLLTALNGPNNQATTDAATAALTRMTTECQ